PGRPLRRPDRPRHAAGRLYLRRGGLEAPRSGIDLHDPEPEVPPAGADRRFRHHAGRDRGPGRTARPRHPQDRMPGGRQDRRRWRGGDHRAEAPAMRRLRVIRGWKDLPQSDRGPALAMGSFDGVHRGHQQVIALAAKAARELGAPLGVITFDPHPRVYFRPEEPAFRLMKPDQQARALEALGVDTLYALP